MRYQPRHRQVTLASRVLSPPTLAAAAVMATGTTAAAAGRLTGSSEVAAAQVQPQPVRRDLARISRGAGRAALPSRSVARALVPVTVPGPLVQARVIDSTATRAAKARLAITRAGYDTTRAALLGASAAADQAHEAWLHAAEAQTTLPSRDTLRQTAITATRRATTDGAPGALAVVAAPVLRAQQSTSEAYRARLAAEKRLRAAADAHLASVRTLTQARDAAARLDAADAATALAQGRVVRLGDGRVVPTIAAGSHVPGTGHTVSSEVSRWIGEALDELYRAGVRPGDRDAEDLAIVVYNESGGNPGVVNTYDSNAAAGMPSFGLMQTIGPTFDAHALPTRRDKADPVAQIIAGARYAEARYGSIAAIPGVRSVRSGGVYRPY